MTEQFWIVFWSLFVSLILAFAGIIAYYNYNQNRLENESIKNCVQSGKSWVAHEFPDGKHTEIRMECK